MRNDSFCFLVIILASITTGCASKRLCCRGQVQGVVKIQPSRPAEYVDVTAEARARAEAQVQSEARARIVARPAYEPISRPPQSIGEWGVRNRSGLRVEVWFCSPTLSGCTFVGRLNNREYMVVEAPSNGARYQAKLLVPNTDGGIDEIVAPVIPVEPNYDGWFVVAPPVADHKKKGSHQ